MPMPSHYRDGDSQPFYSARLITPSDTLSIDPVCRAVLVTVAGNLSVILESDTNAVTIPVNANTIYPLAAKQIKATGTTATGIVGLL